MPEFAPGDVFVGHRIEGLAGRGGMGVVYRARQLDLDRLVALKVIAPTLAEEPDFRARFVAESKAAAAIEHPNVLPVYSAGERDGVLYIVMRYVDGPDLRALVRATEGLGGERAAHIVAQVGAALDAAHAHGLVHRDVKPANVLIGADDHAYLTDFGLTKRVASTAALSHSESWVGTLGYVAPEQIRGDRVDARTDVYALGCVLVHAVTGRAPYVRDSDEATMWAHLNDPPPTDDVPPEFAGVVARALSKDPADRHPSAGDLGRAALAAAGRSGVAAPERVVARGTAAPIDASVAASVAAPVADSDEQTRPSPPPEAPTIPVAPAPAPARGGSPQSSRRARWLALAGVLAAIAAVLVAVMLSGEGDKDSEGEPARTTPTPRNLTADPAISLLTRPNSIAFSGSDVAVLSARDGVLAFVDANTGAPGARVSVGRGAAAVASGFGSLWIAKFGTKSLLRVNPRTLRRGGGAIALPGSGSPVTVASGEGAIWVGTHEDSGVDNLIKVSPRDGTVTRVIGVPGGIHDIAVGDGAVWVTNRSRPEVARISARTGKTRRIRVGLEPHGLAVGEGAAWIASAGDDSVTRIDSRTLRAKTIQLDIPPERIAVGGGSVWVTARSAASLLRIDPRSRRVRDTIRTGRGPFAVGVYRGRAVWLTLVGANGVQRVAFGDS